MPNAKKSTAQPSTNDTGQGKKTSGKFRKFEFIAPYLGADDKSWLKNNLDNLPTAICLMVEQLAVHNRLSLKRDDQSGRWLAILFDDSGEEDTTGIALSVRGKTPIDALYALAYLHVYRFPEGWGLGAGDDDSDPWG